MNIKYPLLLDGGLSNVLEQQGHDLQHHLWTAKLLDKDPEAIIKAHLAYLESGAQCITTASYQASIEGFVNEGYTQAEAAALIIKSVNLAEEACQRAMSFGICHERPLIAASIGPYGAFLADGSEYRGNYDVSDTVLREFHKWRLQLLDNSRADILACETIPGIQEAEILSDLLSHVKTPTWVSFSCKDEEHINDGATIEYAATLFSNHPNVFAIGVNCTHPEYITGLVKRIKSAAPNKRLVVYPNSGKAYNAERKTWMGISEPAQFAEMAKEWAHDGADIIGGCCQIGPACIGLMKTAF